MLNWFKKDKVLINSVIDLSPVELHSIIVNEDRSASMSIQRGEKVHRITMSAGDRFQLYRPITISLEEK